MAAAVARPRRQTVVELLFLIGSAHPHHDPPTGDWRSLLEADVYRVPGRVEENYLSFLAHLTAHLSRPGDVAGRRRLAADRCERHVVHPDLPWADERDPNFQQDSLPGHV